MSTFETLKQSERLFEQAQQVLPGGVSRNTIFRRPHPFYVSHGSGCRVTDIDGNERVDFANNMASLIHGHAHPAIIDAVSQQLARGTAFTMATEAELRFAELMCDRVPWFDKIRFMNSGTEAVMAAIKAARCYTDRPKIAKAEGAYHGTYDYAEVSQKAAPENWGAPHRPSSVPVAQGTPQKALDDVVVLPFNNVALSLELLDQQAKQIACVILDPMPHRVGLIKASPEYMAAIRDWTTRNGALLVLDEVITFRSGYRGAAEWYEQRADLVTMGKIIGGGFPVGALAGCDEVMAVLNPMQAKIPFPHSGTFSANPITMTAGRVAMEWFDQSSVDQLNRLGDYARSKIAETIAAAGARACVTGGGSMFRVHLKETPPTEYRSAYMDAEETERIRSLVDHLFDRGFMMINTCSGALSTAMTTMEVDQLAAAIGDWLDGIDDVAVRSKSTK